MDYLSTIRHGRFGSLWSSQILSQVAQNILNFALIINVYNTAAGARYANILVSLLVLASGLPSILFAAVAGTVVDRWNRRYIMLACNVLRGCLVLLYIPFHHNLWLILILSFVISSITQFFVPAESAMIPSIVEKPQLLAANSLFIFSMYASFIVGYSLAAPLIGWLGEFGPYLVTGSMFGLAALTLFALPRDLRSPSGVPLDKGLATRTSFRDELRMSVKIIRSDRWLGFAIRQLTITQGIVSVILTLAPALSVALLHLPLQRSSQFLIIPAGLGMVTGVIAVQHLAKRWSKVRVLEVGLVVAGVALTLLGLSGLLYRTHHGHQIIPIATISIIVAILVFTLGMFNAVISTTAQTLLQEKASDETRGKVFGTLNMFINLAATLPILITGGLADLLSVTEVIMIIGSGVVIYGVFQLTQLARYRRIVGDIPN